MNVLKKVLTVLVSASIIMLLLYPGQCIDAAKDALNMWLYSVVPSLLPFFVLSSLLVRQCPPSGVSYKHKNLAKHVLGLPRASLYAVFTGMVSGYPAGARITGEMVRAGVLSPMEAVRTLPYTMCCSPTFLVGTVCTALLRAPQLALLLALSHFGSALLCGQFFRIWYGLFKPRLTSFQQAVLPEGAEIMNLSTSIENAMKSMLFVGGNMVIFSIFIQQLQLIGLLNWLSQAMQPGLSVLGLHPSLGVSAVEGVIEMANGCAEVAKTTAPIWQQGALALMIVSFGSLSVAAQSAGMLRGTPIRLRHYFFPKLVHTALSLTVYILLTPFFAPSSAVFGPAFSALLQNMDVESAALIFSTFGTISYIILLILVYNRKKQT